MCPTPMSVMGQSLPKRDVRDKSVSRHDAGMPRTTLSAKRRHDAMHFGAVVTLEDRPFACPQHGVRNHRDFYRAGRAVAARSRNSEQSSEPPPMPREPLRTYRDDHSRRRAERKRSPNWNGAPAAV